jgi:hypothetical protein
LAELTEIVVFSPSLLNFNLAAFSGHNLRPAPIARYLSGDAHPQTFVRIIWHHKFFAIRSPNQNCENFLRAGFIEI